MPGGLIQVVAYGSQDLFLTGTPEITFFKVVYRRYTNYSFDTINIPFNGTTGFGEISQVTIPKIADLIYKTYLQINIPSVFFPRDTTSNNYKTLLNNAKIAVSDATNNYNIVKQFMTLNTDAYRNAYNTSIAVNSNSIDIANEVNKIFNMQIQSVYTTVTNFNNLLQNIDKTKNPVDFNYNTVGLNDLVASVNTSTISPTDLMTLFGYGISQSIKVQQYFYSILLSSTDTYNDLLVKNKKFAWVNRLGHSIIDYIEITIGGTSIDKQYGRWIDIWYELTGNHNSAIIYDKLIGNVPELTSFDRMTKPNYTLYVPLQFWFCRNNGLALPLISLEYHDVDINVKLRNAQDVAYIELENNETQIYIDDLFIDNGYNVEISLLVDFMYLDGDERKKFAQGSHEYLIEQVQVIDQTAVTTTDPQLMLDFFHPCKEIFWITQKNSYVQNTDGSIPCQWYNYGLNDQTGSDNPTISAQLLFNGYTRFDNFDGTFFNKVQPYTYHTNAPVDGINTYSFGIDPEEHQPSGTCNFSRISKAILQLNLNQNLMVSSKSIYGIIDNIILNKIELDINSSNIDNYYNNWNLNIGGNKYTITTYDGNSHIATIDTSGNIGLNDNIYIGQSYTVSSKNVIQTGQLQNILFNTIILNKTSKNILNYYQGWTIQLGTNIYNILSYNNIYLSIVIDNNINKYSIITGDTYILYQPIQQTDFNIYVFAINYNILRFISGMAGLAYI